MKNPFIPKKFANITIIDGRVDDNIVTNLEKFNIKVIKTIKCNEVQESISYHPDIVLHPITHDTMIVAPNVYEYYEDKLTRLGIRVIKGERILSREYPNDIAYNVGRLDGIAIHNFKFTDEKLKFYLKKANIEFLNVNQGYSKCSLAIIDGISGITSDKYMHHRLCDLGYKVLLIEPGYIELKNEKYGFIGGTNGNFSSKDLVFSGKFEHHPDFQKILEFVNSRNLNIYFLSNNSIQDLGTIMNFYR